VFKRFIYTDDVRCSMYIQRFTILQIFLQHQQRNIEPTSVLSYTLLILTIP
jgi:hypothetical protein